MKLTAVYQARGDAEAHMIKELLENSGIASVIKSNAAPSAHVFVVDGLGEYFVMVEESLAEEARKIISGRE